MIAAAELFAEDHREEVVGRLAPELGVVLEAEHPQLTHGAEEVVEGHHLVLLPPLDVGIHLAFDEAPHHLTERVVFVGHPHRCLLLVSADSSQGVPAGS